MLYLRIFEISYSMFQSHIPVAVCAAHPIEQCAVADYLCALMDNVYCTSQVLIPDNYGLPQEPQRIIYL